MINTLKNTQCRQGMGLAALAVAGLLSLSGCSLLGTPRATSTTTTSSLSATQAASTLVGGVCIGIYARPLRRRRPRARGIHT